MQYINILSFISLHGSWHNLYAYIRYVPNSLLPNVQRSFARIWSRTVDVDTYSCYKHWYFQTGNVQWYITGMQSSISFSSWIFFLYHRHCQTAKLRDDKMIQCWGKTSIKECRGWRVFGTNDWFDICWKTPNPFFFSCAKIRAKYSKRFECHYCSTLTRTETASSLTNQVSFTCRWAILLLYKHKFHYEQSW